MNVKKNPRIYPEVSCFKDLIKICEERGDKTAFKYPVGKRFETLSYGDFASEITAIAAGLNALGLSGKRIAVIGETSHQWVASYFATVASGGAIIPMDKELAIEEIEGFRHEWRFWDLTIQKAITFFGLDKPEEGGNPF